MKILLHQCCAPCSIYPLDRLLSGGAEVHGYFYNPNIHPFTEYSKRRDTLVEYNQRLNIAYTVEDIYGIRPFLEMAAAEANRCAGCYNMRFMKLTQYAKEKGFDTISTTLLYSRRQKHEVIRAVGEKVAAAAGLQFWYEDYRKGWQVGIDISKQLGMYRQKYCGCIFSEEERYLGARK